MDVPTRIGLGGTALFTLVGIAQPILTWYVAGPIMTICALVAAWGFWPILLDPPWPAFARKVPLHAAAIQTYEAAERAGALDLTTSPNSSPETKLDHFKMLLMVDDDAKLYGIKPPSTKSRLIPKQELTGELYPFPGERSDLNKLLAPKEVAYSNVTISRRNLRHIIKKYLTEYVPEAKAGN
jgi:hypothetical protein